MSELLEGEVLVVTGTRFHDGDDDPMGGTGDFGEWLFWSVSPFGAQDPFDQYGGFDQVRIGMFDLVDGNLIIRLPGYDFPLKLPAEDWARMNEDDRAAFVKMMVELRDSPMFVETLDRLATQHPGEVVIRYDNVIHQANGNTIPFPDGRAGQVSIVPDPNDSSKILSGSTVVINVNSTLVPNSQGIYPTEVMPDGSLVAVTFAWVVAHEIRHTFYPGAAPGEESQVRLDTETMLNQIFYTPGAIEREGQDYLDSTTIIGSHYNDTASGTSGVDVLSGLSGNDTLNGGGDDDLVMGGAGMDVLSGGSGNNYVLGGLDADTYVPEAGVTTEIISELSGVDRLELTRISISEVVFTRFGDDLRITYATASGWEEIYIEKQWLEGYKIEQFTFAEGTFASSYIEELAGTGPGGVCYDGPNPVICGPYGMPVVLDLDGDGIELIEMVNSKARFDIDGDGTRDRMGWIGADDGLLVLDRNGNGRIDNFSEMSFLQDFLGAGSDLEGLFAYDSNHDGFLTSADDRFSEFLVWRDVNGNGHSEKKELFTLDDLGIVSIGLERRNIHQLDISADRNQVLASSTFETADGRTHQLGDVALFSNLLGCGCHMGGMQAEILGSGYASDF
jgi:hypothetical protein